MLSRAELGNLLLECLEDTTSLLKYAHTIAIEEQNALVQNDAEAITLSSNAQEEVLRRIFEADQRAASIAEQLTELCELPKDSVDHNSLAEAAGAPYTQLIKQKLNEISEISQRVKDANEINHKLLQNGLEIITTCLRTAVCESAPITYSSNASYNAGQMNSVLSLDSRA